MNERERFDQAASYLSAPLRSVIMGLPNEVKQQAREIRLRAEKPVLLVTGAHSLPVRQDASGLDLHTREPLVCSYECLEQTFRAVCGYSIHTYQQEIARGFLTVKGGHRVGIGGTAVEKDGCVTMIKEISSLNIRIARQVFGTAQPLVGFSQKGGLLVAGRPGSGKTTVLRDLCRQLAGIERPGEKVTLIDERGELAAVWDGLPQNDVGMNTDVLNGFSKAAALEIAVRSLSPDVIVCDEIGGRRDAEELLQCAHAGVRIMASVHADSVRELWQKPWVVMLLRAGLFAHIAVLPPVVGGGDSIKTYETEEWLHEMDRDIAGGGGH